jgi:dolichol-phosphate mannosyltransferase
MQLSVVIPVRNEIDNIVPLVREVETALGGRGEHEIVVVDDGSADGTLDRLRGAMAEVPALRVVCHAENRGQSAAIHTGVRHARAAWIATLDGDGQNDPADLPKLIETRDRSGAERLMVVGHRVQRQDDLGKRWASLLANAVRSALLRDETPDSASGIKLFPKALFLELPYFDHMHRFLPALARRQGATVISVPVHHRQRRSGRSHYTQLGRLWLGIVDLLGVWWLLRRARLPHDSKEMKR